jgi:hypothetical protein
MDWKSHAYDLALAPLAAGAAIPMRLVRTMSTDRIPITFGVLRRMGVFPLLRNYYEPLFDFAGLSDENPPRHLPGIDFALDRQTELLTRFDGAKALKGLTTDPTDDLKFYIDNPNFGSGDAEIWFHVIRYFRPARIIEIGSGYSTRMAQLAIETMRQSDASYRCEHVCIEPYEMPWLEQLNVHVIRNKLEDCDVNMFKTLGQNDILFIDSSHMIRPGGEVLQEILQLLPMLAPGVIVHIHDIFTPRDYPRKWLREPRFWNEQYLLEAFMSFNCAFEVLLALNMLKNERYAELNAVCPYLDPQREPGSFYIRRVR